LIHLNQIHNFQNQNFYFNLQKLRNVRTILKIKNQEKEPYLIENNIIKLTKNFSDYANNKLVNEVREIYSDIEKNNIVIYKILHIK